MRDRTVLAATMLVTGALCVAITLIAATWLDTVSLHERSSELYTTNQVELQGKSIKEVPQQANVLSPLMLWLTFGSGCYLLAAGFFIAIRSLRYTP